MKEDNKKLADKLSFIFPELKISSDKPWKMLTTLGIGLACPVLAEPADDIELASLIKFCRKESLKIFLLGNGSNVLGTDCDIPGIIAVKLASAAFKKVKISHVHANAGSGLSMLSFLKRCAKKGIGGASSLSGIPGTLGGAIRMNAGVKNLSISKFIESVCGIDSEGKNWEASASEIKWGNRENSIPDDVIITCAIWKFDKIIAEDELSKISAELKRRHQVEPRQRNAGSIFKNPSPALSAGMLIEKAGCKKLACGEAEVSEKHANYLVNNGNASEADFLNLALKVRNSVYRETGIILNPEIKFANPASLSILKETPSCPKVAVLKGGTSNERDVSLVSGSCVATALRSAAYNVDEIDLRTNEISSELKNADIVFPVLHGGFGENGELQESLEKHGLAFVGCPSQSCRVCMNKILSKKIMIQKGIQTPEYAIVEKNNPDFPDHLKLPLIVKPPDEGSTVGITIVKDMKEWQSALDKVFELGGNIALVEKFIKGKEITVGIIGGKALTPVEISYPGEIYDYDAKYIHQKGETLYFCPPESIDLETQEKAKKIAVDFFNAIGARDLLRVDFIISDSDKTPYVLEGNNLPGFTESSLLPKAAAHDGISFIELCAMLAKFAISRLNKK